MPQRSARLQYILLAVVMTLSLAFSLQGASAVWKHAFHGAHIARQPIQFGIHLDQISGLTQEAVDAGLSKGNTVLSINGRPFTGFRILIEELQAAHPGEVLRVVYLDRTGQSRTTSIRLVAADLGAPLNWFHVITQDLFLRLLIPFCCLALGCWVVVAKPHDPDAWLLLGIFNFFPFVLLPTTFWPGSLVWGGPIWGSILNTIGPLCIMLFGINFPERVRWDVKRPWIKWLVLAPVLALLPLDLFFTLGFLLRFDSVRWMTSFFGPVSRFETALVFIAISIFFSAIAQKLGITTNPDARRRLRVLYIGSAIANTPIALILLSSLVRGVDMAEGLPNWLFAAAIGVFALFPMTLAYVVVVQRAMDIRILIRQGTRYFFASQSLMVLRVLLGIWLYYSLIEFIRHPEHRRAVDTVNVLAILGFFFAFRFRLSKLLQRKIDQRFFREAYSAELVLADLSDEVRNFTQVAPLIDTISTRIGDALHIDRIAVFLRVGDTFQLAHTTGVATLPSASFSLPASSTTITTLARSKGPANVYRDDPSSWLVDATAAERTALADLSTELLVPLPGRNRLIGVMALGAKRSEEPYSRADRQLLQSVASQTGLALENAELLENLSAEVSQRERVSREIEIAREVQQRLFPQTYPEVPGIDLAGYCRPAQAVGGDYYDFFLLPSIDGNPPRLAIAIGDISGKGISAALLMASLRASLRSIAGLQAESGSHDLTTLMRSVNRLVYDSSTSSRYATFFYAEYDPSSRLLTYVNAGHNPPAVLRGAASIPLEPTGMVIGLMPEAEYEQATLPLNPGDVLLAFTDGISEAMTHAEEEWGEDRMFACAQTFLVHPACTAAAQPLLDCILKAADAFTGDAPQHDDMTLLVCTIS
ncbi:hypothetical protein BH10ACI4_BH10ACI4_28160 [soil metagenome]